MQLVGITGPEADAVADRVAERLADRGRVGVVREGATDAPDWTAYVVGDGWTGVGGDRSVDDVLDELARDHDYALLVDFPDARVPQIAVGDADVAAPALELDPVNPDLDSAVDAVEDAEPFETLSSLVADLKRTSEADYAGAVATFTGRVRALEDEDDDWTESLTFEKYDAVAAERSETIREELEARDGVLGVRLHHRVGRVDAGEDIVFVVVLAGHREEAFAAVSDGIDRLKAEVPIFKKEVTVDEEFWVHDRE
ncbi:molybdopterin synthase [Halobacterium litoreum]|uniref:Molybdopterin synthase n=1 Tax=Halobacterium litoreum TaxID=2039234 RepID=A0ABD5NE05_9EURY|nr:molybdopterin synthase [Halobacterium litoreum]UHH13660.1 molybdopterin synthase [Halobacterium litoreum]